MTNTDPAAFNSETTGVFKVQPLSADVVDVRVEHVPVDERYPLSNAGGTGSGPIDGFPERPLMERADEYGDPDHLAERLEARVPLSDPSVGIDEYGHRSDCQGCAACQTPPTMVPDTAYGYVAPRGHTIRAPSAVSLTYAHSDGFTFSRVDVENDITHPSDLTDHNHRERLLLRALLEHTLAVLKGEDVS